MHRRPLRSLIALLLLTACAGGARAAEWPHWRGPGHDGTSPETGLVASWSPQGENLIWRDDWTGRSTPVVIAGRVCANGRAGEGITRQEAVACWDAGSGEKLWERRFNVYHSTVPWNRVGWANLAVDPETAYLYVQGVGGLFFCLDSRDGAVVWSRSLTEDYGFLEGYGGRTQTPAVDEERVIVSFASSNWGDQGRPLHRYYAFDKRTGEPVWVAAPADSMDDANTQSTPAVAVIGGQRLVVAGNGNGWIYAVKARTGEEVWGFHLSQRGINTSVVVDGGTVYAAHSEENLDGSTMGRVVAIDGTGSGDVTATHERWRAPLGVGFSSPALAGGRLFAIDNSANLYALEAASGRALWQLSLGTVGKGSPVVADGKLYATEVNGKFHIVEPGAEAGRILDSEQIDMPAGRYAEIYGSPAVAYGRVYFTTEEGIYCLGDPSAPFRPEPGERRTLAEVPPPEDARPAALLVRPAEVWLRPGEPARFRVEAFDERGRPLGEIGTDWAMVDLAGRIEGGEFTPAADVPYQAGRIEAWRGRLTAAARVRVLADLPLSDDFEAYAPGSRPPYFLGFVARFEVAEVDGNKVLVKGPSPVSIHRHSTFVGRASDRGYTIQADLLGVREGRRVPDMGLINGGYTLDLMGGHQQLQIRSWTSELRMARQVPFAWEPGLWYTMKLRVDLEAGKGVIRGKVWRRGEEEPGAWSLTAEDPLPIPSGSPGLYGYSPAPIYYDNLQVTRNP